AVSVDGELSARAVGREQLVGFITAACPKEGSIFVTPEHPGRKQWTCEHGVTYTGSDEFISGARNAHSEFEGRMPREKGRSVNDIAQEIIDAAPQVEGLVEEWAAVTTRRLNEGAQGIAERDRLKQNECEWSA